MDIVNGGLWSLRWRWLQQGQAWAVLVVTQQLIDSSQPRSVCRAQHSHNSPAQSGNWSTHSWPSEISNSGGFWMATSHAQSSFSRVGLPSRVGFAGRRRAPDPTLIPVLATCSRSTHGTLQGLRVENHTKQWALHTLMKSSSMLPACMAQQAALKLLRAHTTSQSTPYALEKVKQHPGHYSSTLNGHGSTHGNICVLLFVSHIIFMSPSHIPLPPVPCLYPFPRTLRITLAPPGSFPLNSFADHILPITFLAFAPYQAGVFFVMK